MLSRRVLTYPYTRLPPALNEHLTESWSFLCLLRPFLTMAFNDLLKQGQHLVDGL